MSRINDTDYRKMDTDFQCVQNADDEQVKFNEFIEENFKMKTDLLNYYQKTKIKK